MHFVIILMSPPYLSFINQQSPPYSSLISDIGVSEWKKKKKKNLPLFRTEANAPKIQALSFELIKML